MTTTNYDGPERREVTLSDVHEGILRSAEGMSGLAEAINRSTDVNAALMADALRRQSKSRTVWLIILSVLVGIVLLAIVWIGVQQYRGAQRGDRIEDCTTPGRECYERQVAEAGRQVDRVKQDTEAAVRAGLDQAECDFGIYCAPGVTPRTPPPAGTTTTTTAPPATP